MVYQDDYQNIYSFQGANVKNMIGVQEKYPNVEIIKLEQNYRSTNTIIQASNFLIGHNTEQMQKTCFTQNEIGNPIMVREEHDKSREADFVAKTIVGLKRSNQYDYSDVYVLYRSNAQSREIELALSQQNIPYQMASGLEFYDRKEIKDLVGYLRAIDNPLDELAFERIINVPKRGIGKTTIERIRDYSQDCGVSFSTALQHIDHIPKIPKKALGEIHNFLSLLSQLRDYVKGKEMKVSEVINIVVTKTNFLSQFNMEKTEDASRLENIVELRDLASRWDFENSIEEEGTNKLNRFLNETSLVSSTDELDDENNHVTLMSAHSSKGLEAPVVFVVGCQEGVFPHNRSLQENSLEEERRLFYVSLTRAKKLLFLTYSKMGIRWDPITKTMATSELEPSRFLFELPAPYLYVIRKEGDPKTQYEEKREE